MIRGDSSDYDLLKKWCDETKVYTLYNRFYSCEIGVREGLGSKIIMDSFKERLDGNIVRRKINKVMKDMEDNYGKDNMPKMPWKRLYKSQGFNRDSDGNYTPMSTM